LSVAGFNLRVYALIVNEENEVLLSDEFRFGKFFTKFPGGGVEFGEGVLEALKRELREELSLQLNDYSLFYVNDFYQVSAFDKSQQLISFYYLSIVNKQSISTESYEIPFYDNCEKQRWQNIDLLSEDDFTFPVDKVALDKLKTYIKSIRG
jgi:8-oxo-dGTP diphosphatase